MPDDGCSVIYGIDTACEGQIVHHLGTLVVDVLVNNVDELFCFRENAMPMSCLEEVVKAVFVTPRIASKG